MSIHLNEIRARLVRCLTTGLMVRIVMSIHKQPGGPFLLIADKQRVATSWGLSTNQFLASFKHGNNILLVDWCCEEEGKQIP